MRLEYGLWKTGFKVSYKDLAKGENFTDERVEFTGPKICFLRKFFFSSFFRITH